MPLRDPPIQDNMNVVSGKAIWPQTWVLWFNSVQRLTNILRNDGSIAPVSIEDTDAANNSIYYSTTQSKLVYKDSGGTVHDLY